MPRALLPGRWNRRGRAIPDAQACELDSGVGIDMHQGRYATDPVPRVSPLAGVPVQLTGGPVPRRRRAVHFFRALWRFLTDRKVLL